MPTWKDTLEVKATVEACVWGGGGGIGTLLPIECGWIVVICGWW